MNALPYVFSAVEMIWWDTARICGRAVVAHRGAAGPDRDGNRVRVDLQCDDGRDLDATHSYPLAMLPIVAFAAMGAVTLLALRFPSAGATRRNRYYTRTIGRTGAPVAPRILVASRTKQAAWTPSAASSSKARFSIR